MENNGMNQSGQYGIISSLNDSVVIYRKKNAVKEERLWGMINLFLSMLIFMHLESIQMDIYIRSRIYKWRV